MKVKLCFLFHLIVVSILFFFTGSYRNWPYKIESDGKYYYQYLISVWQDGDIDFTNNYNITKQPFMRTEIDHYQWREQIVAATGRPINMFTTGPAVLWMPFFGVVYGTASFINTLDFVSIPLDGWSQFFQYTVMYSSVIYSFISLVLIFKLLTEYFTESISLITIFVVFWATNWVYYSVFEVSMSHTYDLFTLILFFLVYKETLIRQKPWLFILSGFLAGLHVLVRTQNVLTIFIVVMYFVVLTIATSKNTAAFLVTLLTKYILFSIAFLVTLVPLFLSNAYIYGNVFTVPQGTGFLNFSDPALYGVLFSGRNGLYSHHPILLLATIGVFTALINCQREKTVCNQIILPLLLAFVAQLYVNAAAADWWAGHSFGQRRFVSSLLLFAFGLAYLQEYSYYWLPRIKPLMIGLLGLLVMANLYLMVIHIFMWSYDEPHNVVDWMFNRAPTLIYIYVIQPNL